MTGQGSDHVRATDSEGSPSSTVPVPALSQVVARTLPACAVLAFAMPLTLWWLLDTASSELRSPWWTTLLIGVVVLFHVLA